MMISIKHILIVVCICILHGEVECFPQSSEAIARAVKQTELNYYNSDAPDLIPFDNPEHIDNAKEEREGYGSAIESVYDNLHQKTSNFFNPKPVNDGIREADKYGNDGKQLDGVKNIVVSATSVLSNVINAVVDAPGNIITAAITQANGVLNQVGGKIVGLQRK